MFGVLLESRARRQRRTGGAALSVATHLAVISAVAAATGASRTVIAKSEPNHLMVRFVPAAPAPLDVEVARPRIASGIDVANLNNVHIAPLNLHSTTVGPVVDFSGSLSNICIDCDGTTTRPSAFFATNPPKARVGGEEWRGAELLMRILTPAVPRYPEALRSAGVEGTVVVQFSVDTTGRVDMSSVKVLSSTHDLFAAAVRDALARFRFKAAEVDGRRVPALAQMPFEFRLK